jgi:hypothetical protein
MLFILRKTMVPIDQEQALIKLVVDETIINIVPVIGLLTSFD